MASTPIAPYDKDHEDPNGPGDARPTALKVIRDQGLDGKLQGKVFFVTGCTNGIGVETARALHATGADVYITGRDTARGEEVAKRIMHDGKPGKVVFIEMHLDSLASVRDAASKFLQLSDTLNCLICNAGVGLHPKARTRDGFEMHFGTNHLGHFALFEALKDTLLKSSSPSYPSRLVMTPTYDAHSAYGASKTANIWMANEVERRYGSYHLHATSVHPGAVVSGLSRHVGEDFMKKLFGPPEIAKLIKSAEQAAATTIWAAVGAEWQHQGGKYLADVQEGVPSETCTEGRTGPGYAPHAFDEEKEKRLWELSDEIVRATLSD
ncbi:WW domain-containing oxidoreductase [Colletotrichum tropicale]|nr:WW domain-containing oxidoreductase [Colletotrichum tropicale]